MGDETAGLLSRTLPGAWATCFAAANDTRPEASSPVHGSRAMRSMTYDAATGTLRIEWASGNTYDIEGVPPAIAEGLAAARSKGRYFQDHVRDRFPHRRIR